MSMTKRIQSVLQLGEVPNLGPGGIRKLFERLRQQNTPLEYLVEFDYEGLLGLGLTDVQAKVFHDTDSWSLAERIMDAGFLLTTSIDEYASFRIQRGKTSPWYFYVGSLNMLDMDVIGFSGSRDATTDAKDITERISAAAVARGWAVMSGGARGVDMSAHMSAVGHSGATIVVLPQGIATWRMPEELRESDVLVISEFQPFDTWSSFRAMARNKSIVNLSDWLVIPQSGVKGGTWNAGEYAIQSGRPPWVIDMGDEFVGNRALVSRGARSLKWHEDGSALKEMVDAPSNDEPLQPTLF